MHLSGWGNYQRVTPERVFRFEQVATLKGIVVGQDDLISYGNGRSYGDSALGRNIITVKPHNYFLDFDEARGILHVQSGVMLSEIVELFVPRGWFLSVTPGTQLITVGGAIASDVHGKNHHLEGCFSQSVEMFNLMLPDGEVVICSKKCNPELFKATCGGMGLTGVILDAQIRMRKINSRYLSQTTIQSENLRDTLHIIEAHNDHPYSVAWLDCLAEGEKLGRGLVMLGEFCDDGELDFKTRRKLNMPFYLPSFILSKLTAKIFNELYYRQARKRVAQHKVDLDTFFYPLDSVNGWNKIYGKDGFVQYQFVLPKETSHIGLHEIVEMISVSGKGSFLAVLKLHGPENDNYLSFPLEGYSLALDFKMENGIFDLFDRLDEIVLRHGGRFYLAKDVRVTKEVFEKGYPKIDQFRALRERYGMKGKFRSLQSDRVRI